MHGEMVKMIKKKAKILMFSPDYLKFRSIVLHGNPSCGRRDDTCKQTARRTDIQSEARDEENRHFSRLSYVLEKGGNRMFATEIIVIPELVKLSTLFKI